MSDLRRVDFRFRKWDGTPHWVHPSIVLGDDDCGLWLGQSRDMVSLRPGGTFAPDTHSVTVLPPGAGWVATFFPPVPGRFAMYADIVADLDLETLTAIDMDLDVILVDGRVYLDDEDEFAEHRVAMGYPDDVASRAEDDAQLVLSLVRAGAPPFDGRATDWLARFAASRGL